MQNVKSADISGHPDSQIYCKSFCKYAHIMTTNGHPAIDILLIGLGSIGSIYAYILEHVRHFPFHPSTN